MTSSLVNISTPANNISSVVNVPVLSKQHMSTLPAKGIRNGYVQKTYKFLSASKEVFTANESCIGSYGGTTEVMI